MIKNKTINFIMRILLVMACACISAFFFKVIIEGRGLLSMGASGFSVIVARIFSNYFGDEALFSVVYMVFYLLIHIPLFILGYKKISKKFIFLTMSYVVTFSVIVGFIPSSLGQVLGFNLIDDLTSAMLMGLISGSAGVATLFAGGCVGGVDIVSTYLNVKKGKGIGVYNLIFNACVIFVGLMVFKDIPAIIYTLVYAFVSSIVLDRYYNRNKKILLEIVTTKKEEVCKYVLDNAHHGCTSFNAIGAYTNEEKTVIHTVISWFQLKSMTKGIKKIDEKAFIIDLNVYNVKGDFYMPPIK